MEFEYLHTEEEIRENIRINGINPDNLDQFTHFLLHFYSRYRRALPWRETRDPYPILVSEVMLQQTPVERVIPKYLNFVSVFPDVPSLAAASVPEVLTAWQGLGYNRRAIALQRLAAQVQDTCSGVLPSRADELVALPGIGPATASAIMVYAHNAPEVFIETNIRQVFLHFFFPGRKKVHDESIKPLVRAALWRECPRDWYNALMDYGVCLKRRVGNLNRQMGNYHQQSSFEGSDRQYRGRILSILLNHPSLEEKELQERLAIPSARLAGLLAALEKEGFLSRRNGRWLLTP
jgi:A/G-specific adenine glycosylase